MQQQESTAPPYIMIMSACNDVSNPHRFSEPDAQSDSAATVNVQLECLVGCSLRRLNFALVRTRFQSMPQLVFNVEACSGSKERCQHV